LNEGNWDILSAANEIGYGETGWMDWNGIKHGRYTIFKQIMTMFGRNRGKGLGMTKTKTKETLYFS